MGTGSLWNGEDQISKNTFNNKTIVVDTAAVIEGFSNPLEGQMAVPTTDGTTLRKFRAYVWDELNSVWKDQQNPDHTHSSSLEGGTLYKIEKANSALLWQCTETDLLWQVSNGTAPTYSNTISGTDGYREITTAAAASSAGNLVKAGLRYDLAYELFMQFRANFSSVTSSVTTRIGANMEFAHITSNAAIKLGVEACDSCNGVNLRVVSADGSVRSATNTADPMNTTAGFKLLYTPGVNLTYQRNNGTVVTKTSNMPSTGLPDRSNVLVVGIQTTNATAKSIKLWGLKAFGTISTDSNEWI